jgi:hypothetical protein
MRDHLISILQNARAIHFESASLWVKELAESICTETMAVLHGDKTIIPSELFGEIPIPQDVITAMSNGDDDIWFNVSKHVDCNVFYADGWQFNIYPVKNGNTNTDLELEHGKL